MEKKLTTLCNEFDLLLTRNDEVNSIHLDKLKAILHTIIEEEAFKTFFNKEEIAEKRNLISNANLDNIRQLKTDFVILYSQRERDATSNAIRENQLRKNKFNRKKPYIG